MTPPPSEPIRPVGPLVGGVYVDRTTTTDRIGRRRPRRDQDEGDRAHDEDHDDPDAPQARQRPATPIRDPRAYDDHGRRQDDHDADSDRPHIDATA